MLKRILAWAVIPVAAVILMVMEAPMAFGKTVVLFSEFNGLLVDGDGKPQPGVRIERKWRWRSGKVDDSDETATDEAGRFRFPKITATSILASFLPVKAVIIQDIVAYGPDGPVKLWTAAKMSFAENAELDGRPLNMMCRLDMEPDGDRAIWGTCREIDAD